MADTDFKITLLTSESPRSVFQTVMNVKAWWSGFYEEAIEGEMGKLNDEFSFSAAGGAHYSTQKLTTLIPDQKIVWLITGSDFSYLEKRDEWTGTQLVFEISEEEGKTRLTFTHKGLTPRAECYEACAPAWTQYLLQKLRPLINAATV